jgi:hypothetical protein
MENKEYAFVNFSCSTIISINAAEAGSNNAFMIVLTVAFMYNPAIMI